MTVTKKTNTSHWDLDSDDEGEQRSYFQKDLPNEGRMQCRHTVRRYTDNLLHGMQNGAAAGFASGATLAWALFSHELFHRHPMGATSTFAHLPQTTFLKECYLQDRYGIHPAFAFFKCPDQPAPNALMFAASIIATTTISGTLIGAIIGIAKSLCKKTHDA